MLLRKHLTGIVLLSYLSVGLAGGKSLLLHQITTDYGHELFSLFFWLEIAVLLLTLTSGLETTWVAVLYFALFLMEVTLFLLTCLPISPDYLLMLLVGGLRMLVLFRLLRKLRTGKAYCITLTAWLFLGGALYQARCLTPFDRPSTLSRKQETIEVIYIAWACDCANWFPLSAQSNYPIRAQDCVFIDPASPALTVPDTFWQGEYGPKKLRLTGEFYLEEGIPGNYQMQFQKPDRAKVFRYREMEIIHLSFSNLYRNGGK